MPVKTVLKTTIEHISILDEDGNFDARLGKDVIPDADVVRLYEHMIVSRRFDEVAFKLQRSGRMGTYPENRGQEAVSLGAVYVLRADDWLVPCYREYTGLFWRGLPMCPAWYLNHPTQLSLLLLLRFLLLLLPPIRLLSLLLVLRQAPHLKPSP